MLMSAKKYKRNFIENMLLYEKSADVSKPVGNFFFLFFAFNIIPIKQAEKS